MKQPIFKSNWPTSWKESYHYDKVEVFGEWVPETLGYAYAYARRREQTLRTIRNHVPSNGHVLDVAAAQGNFSLSLAEMGYNVTWNDLRAELAGYVQLKYEFGSVAYRSGNCFELAFERLFDAVLITEIIEHVAHPDRFLRKIASLIRPGGKIVMTTPTGEFFRNRLPKFSECSDPSKYESVQFQPNADGHIFLLHADEIHDLAGCAGLQVLDLVTYSNFLTSGCVKTDYLLPWLPQSLVDFGERLTTSRGRFLRMLNTNTLAVLQRT
jgi:2-polyprenyl-6-hydroxyphenyl methylase/3-demethylubiquinone-9 3-methyltransferase